MAPSRSVLALAVVGLLLLLAARPGAVFEGESKVLWVPARWDAATEEIARLPTRDGKLDPDAVQWTEQWRTVEHLEDDLFAAEVEAAVRELLLQGYGLEAIVPVQGGVSQLRSLVARIGAGEPGGGAASAGFGRTAGVLVVGVR